MLSESQRAERERLLDEVDRIQADMDANGVTDQNARAIVENQARINELSDSVRAREFHDSLNAGLRSGRLKIDHGGADPYDDDRPSLRSSALRALDVAVADDRLPARGAELVESLMGSGTPHAQSWTQRWAAATGAPAYERAFAKKLANDHGELTWTAEEADAWREVAAVQTEQRAMTTVDAQGGFMIPLTLDPAVMLTSSGSVNPLRAISRVVQIVTDSWSGITSAGVTSEWTAEAAEVADASPTLGQPSIPVYKGDAFVPFSFELEGDALGFMAELGRLLQDGADQLTASAYTTGSGVGQPTGIITSLVASAGTVPLVTPGVAETLAAGDVYSVQNALPPRFQPRAQWCANLGIINSLRQMETTAGALKFPGLQAAPPVLLGRAMNENSNMDGAINTAATENNYVLLYGAFENFVVVDRLGSTLELVPHLFGATRRPTGQRGALLWFRTGSNVVVPQAFRLLSIPTTA